MKSLLQARSLHSPACEILAERVGRSRRERVLPPVWTSGPLRSWPAAEGRGGGGSADNEFFLRSYDFIQTIKGQIQISNRLFFLFLVKKRLPRWPDERRSHHLDTSPTKCKIKFPLSSSFPLLRSLLPHRAKRTVCSFLLSLSFRECLDYSKLLSCVCSS